MVTSYGRERSITKGGTRASDSAVCIYILHGTRTPLHGELARLLASSAVFVEVNLEPRTSTNNGASSTYVSSALMDVVRTNCDKAGSSPAAHLKHNRFTRQWEWTGANLSPRHALIVATVTVMAHGSRLGEDLFR